MTPGDDVMARHFGCDLLNQRQLDWLIGSGVPAVAIHSPDLLMAAEVAFRGYCFDFTDEAHGAESEPALIILLRDELDACPCDLAAWAPRSGRLATWCDRTSYIGFAYGFRLDPHGALPVHPDPLSWLRSGREGVVIVNHERAGRDLSDAGPFLAIGGADHGLTLQTLLTPRAPRILVDASRQAEAA